MPTLDWSKPIKLVNHQGKIFQARLLGKLDHPRYTRVIASSHPNHSGTPECVFACHEDGFVTLDLTVRNFKRTKIIQITRWVNVYRAHKDYNLSPMIYPSKEAAMNGRAVTQDYVATVPISWETAIEDIE